VDPAPPGVYKTDFDPYGYSDREASSQKDAQGAGRYDKAAKATGARRHKSDDDDPPPQDPDPALPPAPVFDEPGELTADPPVGATPIPQVPGPALPPAVTGGGWGTAIRSRDPPEVFDAPGEPGLTPWGWGAAANPVPVDVNNPGGGWGVWGAAANPVPVDVNNPGGGGMSTAQIAAHAAANPAPVGWAHAPPVVGPNLPAQPELEGGQAQQPGSANSWQTQQTADALLGYAEWAHLHGLPPDPTVLSDHEIRVDPSAALRQYEAAQNPPRVSRR
jgi:hypothetical protein